MPVGNRQQRRDCQSFQRMMVQRQIPLQGQLLPAQQGTCAWTGLCSTAWVGSSAGGVGGWVSSLGLSSLKSFSLCISYKNAGAFGELLSAAQLCGITCLEM